MLKKFFFLTIALASVTFAQGTYEPSEVEETSNYETQDNSASYYNNQEETNQPQQVTYQTAEYEYPSNSNINSKPEPSLYIGIHPVSLIVYTALRMPMIYVTVEKTVSEKSSAIIRPVFIIQDYSSDDIDISILGFGITGAYRHYFNKKHKGFFFEAELQFAYLDIEVSNNYDYAKASSVGFGPYICFGKKWVGSSAISIDIGVGLNMISSSIDTSSEDLDDDIDDIIGSSLGYDFNLIWSLGI